MSRKILIQTRPSYLPESRESQPQRRLLAIILLFLIFLLSLMGKKGETAGIIYSPNIEPNLSHCNKLMYSAPIKGCKKKYRLNRCDKVAHGKLQDTCFDSLAKARNDYLICKNINDEEIQYSCLIYFAKTYREPKVCTHIPVFQTVLIGTPQSFNASMNEKCYKQFRSLNPKLNVRLRHLKNLIRLSDPSNPVEVICKQYTYPETGILPLKNLELKACGPYFKLFRKDGSQPPVLFDQKAQRVAACERIQGPPGVKVRPVDKRCDVPCGGEDLCSEVLLDCASLALPEIPPNTYEGQLYHYKKKWLYEIIKTSPEKVIAACEEVNRSRAMTDTASPSEDTP